MPDITLPHTFVTGDVADANKVAENIHSPNTTPDSLDVINGFLDRANTLGPGTWEPGSQQFQFGALSDGRQVGRTGELFYPTDIHGVSPDARQTISVPGCAIDYDLRLPRSLLLVTWDAQWHNNTSAEPVALFFKKEPADARFVNIAGLTRPIVIGIGAASPDQDHTRRWNGAWMIINPVVGLYQFALGLRRLANSGGANEEVLSLSGAMRVHTFR